MNNSKSKRAANNLSCTYVGYSWVGVSSLAVIMLKTFLKEICNTWNVVMSIFCEFWFSVTIKTIKFFRYIHYLHYCWWVTLILYTRLIMKIGHCGNIPKLMFWARVLLSFTLMKVYVWNISLRNSLRWPIYNNNSVLSCSSSTTNLP